jgi:hypothetical protein
MYLPINVPIPSPHTYIHHSTHTPALAVVFEGLQCGEDFVPGGAEHFLCVWRVWEGWVEYVETDKTKYACDMYTRTQTYTHIYTYTHTEERTDLLLPLGGRKKEVLDFVKRRQLLLWSNFCFVRMQGSVLGMIDRIVSVEGSDWFSDWH